MFAGRVICFVGLLGAVALAGPMPQEGGGGGERPPTKEEIMAMMDCEKPMMSGIACEYDDDSYAELKNFIGEFDAENEDAGAIMQKAASTATKCMLHAKPEDPAPGSFGVGGRPRGPPAFVMEMLQPSTEEGVNRMIFGVVIPSEKPCNFSAIYGGGSSNGLPDAPGTGFGGGPDPPGTGFEDVENDKEAERTRKRLERLEKKTCDAAREDEDYMENCYGRVEFEDQRAKRDCRRALRDLC